MVLEMLSNVCIFTSPNNCCPFAKLPPLLALQVTSYSQATPVSSALAPGYLECGRLGRLEQSLVSSGSAITECSNTDMAVRLVGWSCSMAGGAFLTYIYYFGL